MATESKDLLAQAADHTDAAHDDSHEHGHHHGPYPEQPIAQLAYPRNGISLSLAMLAGLGGTLMILAGAFGVIDGPAADSDALGLFFAIGLALFLTGSLAWLAFQRPWEIFPSVTEGYYDKPEEPYGTHHDDDVEHQAHQPALPEGTHEH